jgi:15-cis-phytoene synthase
MMSHTIADNDAVALRELLPVAGSDLYYALRYAPPDARPDLALVEAFRALISALPWQCSNSAIAMTKLTWWHEELHQIGTRNARHAMTRALAPIVDRHTGLLEALFALVNGTAALLNRGRFDSVAERRVSITATHAPLWRVHAEVCGESNPLALDQVAALGAGVETALIVRALRRHIDAGLAFICQDIQPHDAAQAENADWYAALARLEIPILIDDLRATRLALLTHATQARRLRPTLVLTALAIATLQEIAADGYRVWERRIELTPLRKWWLAQRSGA